MKKLLVFLSCIFLIMGCSTTKILHEDLPNPDTSANKESSVVDTENDGSSYEKAIIIKEKSESKGVNAEYKWLRQNYPGYSLKLQSLNFYRKKPYDIIKIVTSEGVEKSIYFDISNFYGKF